MSAETGYRIVDLGTLGGADSAGLRLNERGEVTGWSNAAGSFAQRAFVYRNGQMLDLDPSGGAMHGAGINESGAIAGTSPWNGTGFGAFVYSNGQRLDLPTLGGSSASANDVNDALQVTGSASLAGDGSTHAVLYSAAGVAVDLGTLGGTNSNGLSINNSGQVTGVSQLAGDEAAHAFLYSNGVMTDLGTFQGDSAGHDINAFGHVVGQAYTAFTDSPRAFLYKNGTMRNLETLGGDLSSGNAINDHGDVVGSSWIEFNAALHAFIFRNDQMHDLNDLLGEQDAQKWLLTSASDINNFGQITGTGIVDGHQHAFLMTPVPQPATLALFACGLGMLLLMGRKAVGRRIINGPPDPARC